MRKLMLGVALCTLVSNVSHADGPGVVTQIVAGGPALPNGIQFQTGGPSWYCFSITDAAADFMHGHLLASLAIGRVVGFNVGGLSNQDYVDCSAPNVSNTVVSRISIK